jgi:hypothetical protein
MPMSPIRRIRMTNVKRLVRPSYRYGTDGDRKCKRCTGQLLDSDLIRPFSTGHRIVGVCLSGTACTEPDQPFKVRSCCRTEMIRGTWRHGVVKLSRTSARPRAKSGGVRGAQHGATLIAFQPAAELPVRRSRVVPSRPDWSCHCISSASVSMRGSGY